MDTAVFSLNEGAIQRIELEIQLTWSDMRHSNLLFDAALLTEDGGSFKVHRIVMDLCSGYFKALFLSKVNVEPRNCICIPGISADILKEIVEFAYSGSVNITEENVGDLLIAADQFNVVGVLKKCCDFIQNRMDIYNCISVREFADFYFCFELQEAAHKYLMWHFAEIVEKSLDFVEMPLEKVATLLNSEYINARNEELVWEAGLRWIDYNPLDRKKHISSILKCVRLGLLDNLYFMERVRKHPYVESSEICKPIVIETLRFLWDLEQIGNRTEEVKTPFLAIPRIPFSILFTIGGWSGGSPTNMIETYDTKADRWIKVHEVDPTGPRAYHKLAVIGYVIYVIGGFDGNEYFNYCRSFNAVTKEWKDIAPMNSRRCYVSVATVNDVIYAMGGYDGHHRQNTVEKFDFRRNQWSFVAPMNVQRSDACATSHKGVIYIAGGFNGSECLASCEYYNPVMDQWTTVVPMRNRRSGVSIISYHDKIYALGGFNGQSRLSSGEKYDPETNQWTEVPDMFNPRSNFAIEVMDDLIFVIGGFNGASTIFHVECFNDQTGEWYQATDMNAYRSALAACVVPALPNINDFIHQNRQGLMEEKRQKLLEQMGSDIERSTLGFRHNFRVHDQEEREIEERE